MGRGTSRIEATYFGSITQLSGFPLPRYVASSSGPHDRRQWVPIPYTDISYSAFPSTINLTSHVLITNWLAVLDLDSLMTHRRRLHEEQVTAQPHQVVQDGAPSHTARGTITEMQNRGLHLLGHPASSPDLNLAEHPIGKIKYNLMNRRERRPTNEREFRAAIEWERTTCPREKLAHLCETFPDV